MFSHQNEFELTPIDSKEELYNGRDWALPLCLIFGLAATGMNLSANFVHIPVITLSGYYTYVYDFNGILLLYLAVFPIIVILTG